MDSRTPQSRPNKRPIDKDSSQGRSIKRFFPAEGDQLSAEKVFKFRVLLPNGTSVDLNLRRPGAEMTLEEFVHTVKREYLSVVRQTEASKPSSSINWSSQDFHLFDANANPISKKLVLNNFRRNSKNPNILLLQDGSAEIGKYENMWDLTPDTDLLRELPEHYTFETALADLIDNSLQAVWSNGRNERRLIRVELAQDKIEIFDTGPGMDGSDENSIAKWGKIGASLHRLAREQGIESKPPYLAPLFGMYGYGGPFATMHLGRRALISSKTKQSKKVYMLHLERESLLSSSSGQTWRANGGLRDADKDELEKASHGSFTKVEIFNTEQRSMKMKQLKCRLKDIYFPYIQCDELSRTGKTQMPIEFQVNGIGLAEILGGEVAVTNVNSCNGPDFTLQLHLTKDASQATSSSNPGYTAPREANARLKCVYFPITQGKESIDKILEELKRDGCGNTEDFKTFSRVSVRRLGRLLPDARWVLLPFMEPKHKKGEHGQILKRCCYRVKCFIDTDAGFKPTPSKTDLAHQNPYTIALKSFGKKHLEKEKDVHIEINKDGKELNLAKLEKLYEDWIISMHKKYDEEIGSGNDEPTFVVNPSDKQELGISSKVIRVHKVFRRKGAIWKSGQKIKILKGAYVGHHKTNSYATLEFVILEGWEGDAGGEARLICRPISIPDESGCRLVFYNENPSIKIGGSISLPVNVIDSGKCVTIDDAEWENQLQKHSLKVPSSISLLSAKDCQELGIGGALPDNVVCAGCDPPEEIVAVVRPASFSCAVKSKNLDRKYIVQDELEMTMDIKFRAVHVDSENINIFSMKVTPSIREDCRGFYIFQLGNNRPNLFQKAGLYTFLFCVKGRRGLTFEKKVKVRALSKAGSWRPNEQQKHLNTENASVRTPCSKGKSLLCQESSELDALCNSRHHSAQKRILLLRDSSEPSDMGNLIESKMNHRETLHPQELPESESEGDDPHQSAERRKLLPPDFASSSVMGNKVKCEMKDHEELWDELCQYGLCIKQREMNIESLNLLLSDIERDMSNLQGSPYLDLHDLERTAGKKLVAEQIVCRGDSAAAVICRLFQSVTYKEKGIDFADKVLGVVALLGTVQTHDLSRIFAQYLGEHQMLAIVCKSYADAAYLEKHDPDGRVNNAYGLHELATKLGISINRQYHVLCVENIRPYAGDFSSDPQRYLSLPEPTLPNGKPPPGFLGYAVNMIELDVNFWFWRTASGHGLRETLFYRLFGELQVYENRQCMNMASCCIKDGAVSLDGGILRGNGVISLGHWEPDVKFPVLPLDSQRYFSPRKVEVLKEIEAKKQELRETNYKLKAEQRTLGEVMKKFKETKERYQSLLDEKEKSLSGLTMQILNQ
ncbi:structural maintenance of chromosomes flexible hinge domain-containing protein GMI1 isoform X1 [Coffea eugenioides]|uniref:structural maintenance of chromosomes flexible hinge domain-containing protein GMI1 isoform X1 n=1 Tax=Coffea eugenioides TaxID=49369 RepID=UPI000F60BF94|nr:structural maintenance of chromosomes flexible hinge domain-containing protein GMI1 isoform X1 [Coffea eugenioides]